MGPERNCSHICWRCASLIVAITFLGGLQLMGIGVIGEYLGRTYLESKRRPVYLIRRVYTRPNAK